MTIAGSLWCRTVVAAILLAAAPPAMAQSVTTYHGDAARSGGFVAPGLTWDAARRMRLDRAFTARFRGNLYAQPLYWQPPGAAAGMLVVASESDEVAALDPASGRILWRRTLGVPEPLAAFPCGNIDPLGVTGTPVIDRSSGTLFLDAMVRGAAGPSHRIFALSLADGAVRPGWPVDVAAALRRVGLDFDPRVQNQRAALALLAGRVYVGFGGFYGDCGAYHGWVVGVAANDPQRVVAWRARGRGGAVWAPGGIASDGRSVYFATGNTLDTERWADGEAVFRLPPDLRRSANGGDWFAPADWHALDARDLDLGGTNPLLFAAGAQRLVLAVGKNGEAFLLDPDHLGGIGGALHSARIARPWVITAPAVFPADDAAIVALAARGVDCPGGDSGDLTALRITGGHPPAIATAWCGAMAGRGEPIVTTTDGRANPIVWAVGAEGDNRLHGFRGDNGAPLYTGPPLAGLRHFATLIVVGNRLYAGADNRLYAFSIGP